MNFQILSICVFLPLFSLKSFGNYHTLATIAVKPIVSLPSKNVPALDWQLAEKDTLRMTWPVALGDCPTRGPFRAPTIWELHVLYQQMSANGEISDKDWFWTITQKSDTYYGRPETYVVNFGKKGGVEMALEGSHGRIHCVREATSEITDF